jgi:hypothetical protein
MPKTVYSVLSEKSIQLVFVMWRWLIDIKNVFFLLPDIKMSFVLLFHWTVSTLNFATIEGHSAVSSLKNQMLTAKLGGSALGTTVAASMQAIYWVSPCGQVLLLMSELGALETLLIEH